MKDNFHVDKSLMQLSEVLSEHDPYAVLVVSTTGLDNKDCDKHSPTRVQLVQFEFDNELKQYTESISFNKLVAADIEAVNAAVASAEAGGYDALKNAEIDVASYKMQIEDPTTSADVPENQIVLRPEEFRKSFEYAMTAIQHDNTTLIVNGFEHSQKYLDKIGCADQLTEIAKAGKTLDQPSISGEYMSSHGLADKKSVPLETIRNAFMAEPNIIKQFNTPEMQRDFAELSKEDFLKANPKTSEKAYDAKVADVQAREAKATAPERVQIINQLVTAYGREQGILESEHLAHLRERNQNQREGASERAKRRYDNSPVYRKIETQIQMGTIDREAVLSGDSQYQKLMDALSGENGKKGVAFVHIATSGMDNPRRNATGLPIQLYVRIVPADEEGKGLDASKTSGFNFYMNVPNSVVLQAEQQAKNGKFDVFKDAGIDPEQYKSGVITSPNGKQSKVYSEPDFANIVNTLFSPERIDPEQYTIISIGKGKEDENDKRAFFQKALASVCNNSVVNVQTVDVLQAISEYALLTVEGEIEDNVLFDNNTDIKGFGIRDIANALNKELNGTGDKVNTMFMAVSAMYSQYLELTKEERAKKREQEEAAKESEKSEKVNDFMEVDEIDVPMSENFAEETSEGVLETEDYEDEEPDFADEDGYDGETYFEEPQEPPVSDDRENFEFSGMEQFFTNAEEKKKETESKKENTVSESKEDKGEGKVTPLHPNRRKADERPERPVRKAAEPNSADVQSLYAIIEQQSKQIIQQSATIQELSRIAVVQAEQANTRMFNVLQQQNELMQTIIKQNFQSAPNKVRAMQKQFEGDVIERLEQIKDAISDICKEVPDSVSEYLHEANASIAEGQQEYESPAKEMAEPKPVA